MTILINYPFDEAQMAGFRAAAQGAQMVQARDEAEAVRLVAEAEALLGHFPPAVFAAGKRLRWVQSFSAGMDRFLFPAVIESDVVVTNMAGLYASQGGEHAWAFLLALARGIPQFVRSQQRHEWQRVPMVELRGGVLGIIGMGGFGIEMARRAAGYDMHVIALDPMREEKPECVDELHRPTRAALEDLLTRSDAVMIACPKTPETINLIGAAELQLMKRTAYLINVTRGGIIDEAALADALQRGEIAGAGLDVFTQEPLTAESPLWDCENCLISTHCAGASQHRPRLTYEFFRDNLRRFVQGEPLLNVVDKQRGF
jgi:phosphoglycerate dehydrogenase-like enzyme